MGLKAMPGCSRTRLCTVLILLFVSKTPLVSCSRLGASVFDLDSSTRHQGKQDHSVLNPPPQLHSAAVQHHSAPTADNRQQPSQMSTSTVNADSVKKYQGLDPEWQRHPKLTATGDDSEKGSRRPPSFQMLPRNTRPPPRGPSPGSNSFSP